MDFAFSLPEDSHVKSDFEVEPASGVVAAGEAAEIRIDLLAQHDGT